MNRVELIGRLTRDPELRYTESNIAICSFSIAVHRPFKNEETKDYDVDYINCKVFRKRAETVNKYLKKGDLVGVEGSIRTGSYEKDGRTIYTTDVVVDNIHFLNTNKEQKKETIKEENNSDPLSDDVFREFGEQIEIDPDDIAF